MSIKDRVGTIDIFKNERLYNSRPIVSYSASQGSLYFNAIMTEQLGLVDWKAAMVGYDKKGGILVLKKCDGEDHGSTTVRGPSKEAKRPTRTIKVSMVSKALSLTLPKLWNAEVDGDMIYLEATE